MGIQEVRDILDFVVSTLWKDAMKFFFFTHTVHMQMQTLSDTHGHVTWLQLK
jgi:hypothetical protein